MAAMTTRTLQGRQRDGTDVEVVLTIFEPVQREADDWRCGFDFEPPIPPRNAKGRGADWINAFLHSLSYARQYFETQWSSRNWQGLWHLGLPSLTEERLTSENAKIPPLESRPESLTVLAKRTVGIPDKIDDVREITLTLYSPVPAQHGTWKCAYSFDPIDGTSIRYGTGADYIEATLAALAGARAVYDSMIPPGWKMSGDSLDCSDLPVVLDRMYLTNR